MNLKIKLLSIENIPYLDVNSKKINLSIASSIYEALEELRSLNTGLDVKFENYNQFAGLINEINKITQND